MRNKQFEEDIKRYKIKTGKTISRTKPNSNDILAVQADSKIRVDLKSEEPAEVQREVQIYKITLDNVNKILQQINNTGTPTQRPSDYLAEMYKSDKHMEKIRKGLVERQETIKESNFNVI